MGCFKAPHAVKSLVQEPQARGSKLLRTLTEYVCVTPLLHHGGQPSLGQGVVVHMYLGN
ncbi:unnamed protein product [Spirodela intermedia]|uniref:Uncharacterized protein n=1 Tax=Spirodela intermedia TaxID=51605 RepID=A0ABN7EC89_SPIIN|nr:unnamed protein product [Spirodela intermedia]